MLVLTFKVGETWTFMLPDGQQAHAFVEKITERQVRVCFHMPDQLRVTRDTAGAARVIRERNK